MADLEEEARLWRRIVIGGGVASVLILGLLQLNYRNGAPFDRQAWLAAPDGQEDCVRGAMVSDLEAHYLRRGVTSATVIDLLGPGATDAGTPASCRSYLLGMCSGFGIDYDGLFVCFDGEGRLAKTYTQQF
jgi:hypothetical protein